jgi:hypothetical protein
VDSTGQTIDFLLSAKRDAAAAKRFFRKALSSPGNPVPRVINGDKNRAFPPAVEVLKDEGILPRRVRLRPCKYLNNVVEQDHRTVTKRAWLAKGYGSFSTAWRTLQEIETVHMIWKGRVRWVAKRDALAAANFIAELFGVAGYLHLSQRTLSFSPYATNLAMKPDFVIRTDSLKPEVAQPNVGYYAGPRKCGFYASLYKSRPSGRLGDEVATFFRNARLRSLFASLCFRWRWNRALSPFIADMVTQE